MLIKNSNQRQLDKLSLVAVFYVCTELRRLKLKKLYICEYPYVLYKVLIKAALNDNGDIVDIVLTNRMDRMTRLITQLKRSNLFGNVYFYDLRNLNLKYDMFLHKFDENIVRQRLYELKIWGYFYKIANSKKLRNMEWNFNLDQYDEICCTDGTFIFEAYFSAHKREHILIEHARDVHIKKNYSFFASVFHTIEQIIDKYDILMGIGIASKYCTTMEVNSDMGNKQADFLKNKKIRIWNVEEHIEQLTPQKRELILDVYIRSYLGGFDYDDKYNLLLTNPLYIDGDVSSEQEQIEVYLEMIRQYKLDDGNKLLIKAHPRDNTDYRVISHAIIIDSMVSSEILCISKRLKLHTVVTLYSSSAQAFKNHAEKIIQVADSEDEVIEYCKKVLKN